MLEKSQNTKNVLLKKNENPMYYIIGSGLFIDFYSLFLKVFLLMIFIKNG